MFTNDLYKKALLDPARDNNSLYIVSGYSSATFVRKHLKDLSALKKNIDVNLIIGMKRKRNDHQAYLNLKQQYKNLLNVHYIQTSSDVHNKAYAWMGGNPKGFSGSANYSQEAFHKSQINQLEITDPKIIKKFYDSLLPRAVSILHFDPSQDIVTTPPLKANRTLTSSVLPGTVHWIIPDVSVKISFLTGKGIVPPKSSVNMGFAAPRDKNKPLKKRRRDEAELRIRVDANKTGFLPGRTFNFTLIGDDGFLMDCVVGQDNNKAISTTDDNAILGAYIRKRIGVPNGHFITTADFKKYGRTDFTLTKLDNGTFEIDLSVPKTAPGKLPQKIMLDSEGFNK